MYNETGIDELRPVEDGSLPNKPGAYSLWSQEELEDYFTSQEWNMDGWPQKELERYCAIYNVIRGYSGYEDGLEDSGTRKPGVCGRWAWQSKEGKVSRFFCGSRRCERTECRKIFAWRRVRLLTELVEEYELRYFYTLTLNPENFVDDLDAWLRISGVWANFLRIMKRKYPDFKFASVLEKHRKNGRPHIHGFCNLFIHWEEWKHHWSACGGGEGVWLEKVQQSQSLSQYVAKSIDVCKYVAKEALTEVAPQIRRTFWRSAKMKSARELTKNVTCAIVKGDVFDSTGRQLMFLSGGGNDGEQLEKSPCTVHEKVHEASSCRGKEDLERRKGTEQAASG